ncbi:MAG: 1-(5-phosphoribosyl)-5-[(5-phosphoribosylamino)methylideneamino]imidazole-4-carboxamide isomerase [bacterium]
MIVYPAIDLMGGQAVRLRQGDVSRRTDVGGNPVALARRWADEGARWLHVVDLDGAREGSPRHLATIERICADVPIPVQVGGGLRSLADLRAAFGVGAARAILGTAAIAGALLPRALEEFGERIAVAVDVREDRVAIEGWQSTAALSALDAAQRLVEAGTPRLIYTDVARDGMLSGPDLTGLAALIAHIRVPVILSGGVASPADVAAAAAAGAEGVIIGRALYEGRLSLAEALRMATGAHAAAGAE